MCLCVGNGLAMPSKPAQKESMDSHERSAALLGLGWVPAPPARQVQVRRACAGPCPAVATERRPAVHSTAGPCRPLNFPTQPYTPATWAVARRVSAPVPGSTLQSTRSFSGNCATQGGQVGEEGGGTQHVGRQANANLFSATSNTRSMQQVQGVDRCLSSRGGALGRARAAVPPPRRHSAGQPHPPRSWPERSLGLAETWRMKPRRWDEEDGSDGRRDGRPRSGCAPHQPSRPLSRAGWQHFQAGALPPASCHTFLLTQVPAC